MPVLAFAVRRRHFPDEIHFHAPGVKRYETSEFAQAQPQRFVPVSVTGTACALDCDHCGGQILRFMRGVPDGGLFALCERLAAQGTRGILLSGGCDGAGRVPLTRWAREVRHVREELGMKVIVHTGLIDEPMAAALAEAGVEAAMMDVIGANETIRHVYHLNRTVDDYEASLHLLEQYGVPAMPHIILGLHYSRFLGEENALEMIARHAPAALVLVVLMPLLQTRMAHVRPPALDDIVAFFKRARLRLPTVPIFLGCARPAGEMKEAIDKAAVDTGLNGIAYPVEGVVAYAASRGLTPRFHETCCGIVDG